MHCPSCLPSMVGFETDVRSEAKLLVDDVQIYIPKIPGIPSNYEYSPSDFHLEYEVCPSTYPP